MYLASPIEDITDPLKWWYKHHSVYPHLSQMAADYLLIPGAWYVMLCEHN